MRVVLVSAIVALGALVGCEQLHIPIGTPFDVLIVPGRSVGRNGFQREVFMRRSSVSILFGLAAFAACSTIAAAEEVGAGHTPPKTDEEMITNALSAAPENVAANATVIAFGADGKVRTLREGSNNFTCIPDDPTNPANDPLCVDKNGWEWVMAWVGKTELPKGKVGFAYMLQGGTTPSNVDPYATKPLESMGWMQEPPHVMVMNYGDAFQDYPKPGEMADMTQPWVMWAGSPYEHLMLPVK